MSCKIAREGRLLRITLARSEKRNALNLELCRSIVDTVEAARPEDTGAVFLDAEGPSFCSGMDLAESVTVNPAELAAVHERLFTLGRRAAVPVVAYAQGHAIAGGTGLAANTHLLFAAEDAKFGLTELRVAMWPFLIYRAVEDAIGARRTLAWSLAAETITAEEARNAGLVHAISTHDAALAAARELSERLPEAVRLGIEYYRVSRGQSHEAAGALAATLRRELMAAPGYAEAVRQFRSAGK